MSALLRHTVALLRAAPRVRRAPRRGGPPRLRFAYPELGAPTRYRVHHHVEEARIAGLEAEAVSFDDAGRLYDLSGCDLLYIHRTPLAPRSAALLLLARLRRIPVLYDTDDLTWDERERGYEFLDDHYDARTVARIVRTARRARALMRRVDAFVFSTPELARLAGATFSQPAFVCENAVSREMAARSAEALEARGARRAGGGVVLGYFSGHPRVHDEDVATVAQALCDVLGRFPQARLRIVGELGLRGPLAGEAFAGRIERRPAVDWRALPGEIAQVDINIAPLVDNPQRRAKSAIKYLEAALVGVPTVAARLEPYAGTIAERRTGLLAASHEEWVAALELLVESPALRDRLGAAARAHVLAEHTTDARAPRFAEIVRQALGRRGGAG